MNKKLKLLNIAILFLFFSKNILAEELPQSIASSDYYFLIDADTKEVFLSKNADVSVPPSSMTKLMTAYVIFDLIKSGSLKLDNKCFIGKDAWRKYGSSMFLNYGDVVSVEELLKGLLVVSGNDAATALAESTAGGIANFLRLMNLKSKEINMRNSHFMNPHGLYQEGHYMTLRDLAILTMELYQRFPEYVHYFEIPEFTYRNITQQNRNPLIRNNYDGVVGGKTGHTNQGGYGIVATVKRDNRRLIAVVNKAKTSKQREQLVTDLFDYGFNRYKKLNIFTKGQTISSANVWLGSKSKVDMIIDQDVSISVPREIDIEDVKVSVIYKDPIYAPILKAKKVANLKIEIKNFKNFEYSLYAKETVDKVGYIRKIINILKYKVKIFYNKYFSKLWT